MLPEKGQLGSALRHLRHYITDRYLPLWWKFGLSHLFAMLWLSFSVWLSIPWIKSLGAWVSKPLAVLIIGGIAYLPGYINAFTVMSLLLDRQPGFRCEEPKEPVTVLIACHNEERSIGETLDYLARQSYAGDIRVIVIDNNSSDLTSKVAEQTGNILGLNLKVLRESRQGKHHALNTGLAHVETPWVVTLDADTLLLPFSLRYLMRRALSGKPDVCAVAGSVLVRNGRKNLLTRLQEWEYFLGIASVKRLQGMYQGTLVAQGAYSVFRTEVLRRAGGFPDVIGEDIVLTWLLLQKGWKVNFEPLAVAFTQVPERLSHLQRQRSRWARGMIEALRRYKPWRQPSPSVRYFTMMNLLMPYMDAVYTLCWIPGLVLALFGHFWIVGPFTLLVLPLSLIQNAILYRYQKRVFRQLRLRIRKNLVGFFLYVVFFQMLMSPISLLGYLQEAFRLRRVWK